MDRNSVLGKTFHREFAIEARAVDADKRTIELAFSSELPVDRGGAFEILDHDPKSVDLSRLQRGAALLVNHDRDQHVGRVESARIDADKRGRAVVRFGRSARAGEIWQDVQDGIRTLVSVGYAVRDWVTERTEDGVETYRVTRWEPLELSIVSVPADASVGVGRELTATAIAPVTAPSSVAQSNTAAPTKMETRTMPETPNTNDLAAVTAQTRGDELTRAREIRAIAKTHNVQDAGERAISEGTSVADFARNVLAEIATRQAAAPVNPAIGLSQREVKEYSVANALRAALTGDWSKAGLEQEASRAHDAVSGLNPRGTFRIPFDVLASRGFIQTRTNQNVTTVGEGGYLVATDYMAGSFIDLLRANSVAMQLCTVMPGLVGNVAIAKQLTGSTAYWVGEASDVTGSYATFGQVSLSPNTVGALVPMTRQLMLQSNPAIEQVIRNDITQTLGLAIDLGVFEGTGTTQPTGITQLGGNLNSVSFGGAPSWGKIVDMVTAVTADKVPLVKPAYVGSAEFVGKCLQTEKTSTNGQYLMTDYKTLNGYPFYMSTNITNTNLFFGSWNNALLGLFGGLDILVDPFTYSASGTVRIVAFQSMDLAVRYDKAFCISSGLTVT